MRIHEILNAKPLEGMLEATTSGTEGTEAARKPYKPYRPCKARKPRKPYTTEEMAPDAATGTSAAVAAKNIIAEAAARPYQPASPSDPQNLRFKDFLFRLAEHRRAKEAAANSVPV